MKANRIQPYKTGHYTIKWGTESESKETKIKVKFAYTCYEYRKGHS